MQVIQKRTQTTKLAEPSLSSAPHRFGATQRKQSQWQVDCATITVHAGKCYKALINPRTGISLL